MTEYGSPVRLEFGRCAESIVARAVVATADQLCSMVDMSLDLLEALEIPLSESIGVLHPCGIDRVTVWTDDRTLSVEFVVDDAVGTDLGDVFGEALDVVASFFEISRASDGMSVSLEGSLG